MTAPTQIKTIARKLSDAQRAWIDGARARIDDDWMRDLLVRLVEIPSPWGDERAIAGFLAETMADLGLAAEMQEIDDRSANAIEAFRARHPSADTLVVAGGVAANRNLRRRLADLAGEHGMRLVAPPARLCTDNAVMIAWAGVERLGLGLTDGLDFAPRPRWPLDPDAPPAVGAGVKA